MPKLAKRKPENEGIEHVKVRRIRTKETRCFCGSKLVRGECLKDHDEMAKARGHELQVAHPLIAHENAVYIGLPWTTRKLNMFRKLTSNPIYEKTLDRKVECPTCHEETTWGSLTFTGCQNRLCAKSRTD